MCRERTAFARSPRCRSFRSEEHTSELQSLTNLVCRLLLEKKKRRHVASYCALSFATCSTPNGQCQSCISDDVSRSSSASSHARGSTARLTSSLHRQNPRRS